MNYRPAGLSESEDEDFDGFEFASSPIKTKLKYAYVVPDLPVLEPELSTVPMAIADDRVSSNKDSISNEAEAGPSKSPFEIAAEREKRPVETKPSSNTPFGPTIKTRAPVQTPHPNTAPVTNGTSHNSASSSAPNRLSRDPSPRGSPTPPPTPPSGVQRTRYRQQRSISQTNLHDDLRLAVMQGNLDIVKELLKQGVEVDQVLRSGWTSLMYGCSRGKHEVVKYLLSYGADPNFSKDRFTSLMAACASTQENESDILKCVEYLLEGGVSINEGEKHRMTPLMFACKEGKMDVVKKLLENMADHSLHDNHGWTALMWASSKGNGMVVRVLLDAGADPTLFCSSGQTAADLASYQGHGGISDILSKVITSDWRPGGDSSLLDNLGAGDASNNMGLTQSGSTAVESYSDLEMVLAGLQIPEYIHLFKRHKVTFESFLNMDEDDLEKVGIQEVGVRQRIMKGIMEIHKKCWEKSSLPQLQSKKFISCPDAVALVANIAKHLHYIQASVGYVHKQILDNPQILEIGQEAECVTHFTTQTTNSLTNCHALHAELRHLLAHLYKVQNKPGLLPADLVSAPIKSESSWKKKAIVISVLFGTISAFCYIQKPQSIWSKIISILPTKNV